jgi:hypothetical protein
LLVGRNFETTHGISGWDVYGAFGAAAPALEVGSTQASALEFFVAVDIESTFGCCPS